MSTETKFLGTILIATLLLIAGSIFFFSRKETSSKIVGTVALPVDYSKGNKIGSDSAKVKLVEFSDYQCPACAAAQPFIKKIMADYPLEVQLTYRNFPLPQHIHSRPAATAAEAAAEQGKFWEMHDKLFETQNQWSGTKDVTSFFLELAKELELDQEKIKEALEKNTFKAKISEDIAEGERLGVVSTPTFFLNGRKLNLQKFADLHTAVAEELKK